MLAHGNHAYAHARETFAPADLAPSFGIAQPISHPLVLTEKPKRGLLSTLRDLSLLVLGWTLFIGVIVYPVAHLVGLAACTIALVILPADRR
jgi:hypothetical protein